MPITVEVVSPEKLEYSEPADSIVLPGTIGELEVLPGHVPLLTTIKPGALVVKHGGKEEYFAVAAGFVEVLPDRVTVLTDAAETEDEIDIERAERALQKAQDRLSELGSESVEQRFAFESALQRALARIAVYQHRQTHPDHDDD